MTNITVKRQVCIKRTHEPTTTTKKKNYVWNLTISMDTTFFAGCKEKGLLRYKIICGVFNSNNF